MLSIIILIAGAALPSFLLIAWIYHKDRARPEPLRLVGRAVALGLLGTIPAIVFGIFLDIPRGQLPGPWLPAIWAAFVSAALLEESVKFFIIKRFFYTLSAFDEVLDGIVYAMCVSLGFAFAENILYGLGDHGLLVLRAFTAVPLHAAATGIMGYWFGRARMEASAARAGAMQRRGLVEAILSHGFYNVFLLLGGGLGFLALLVLGLSLARLGRLIRCAQRQDARLARQRQDAPTERLF